VQYLALFFGLPFVPSQCAQELQDFFVLHTLLFRKGEIALKVEEFRFGAHFNLHNSAQKFVVFSIDPFLDATPFALFRVREREAAVSPASPRLPAINCPRFIGLSPQTTVVFCVIPFLYFCHVGFIGTSSDGHD
jgi:hypothetical protein